MDADFDCAFSVSWAVRYGLSRVFAFSVKVVVAAVFSRSHAESSVPGESGRGGGPGMLCSVTVRSMGD